MINITPHPALWQCLQGTWGRGGIQGTHFLIDWIILACRETWPNEGFLSGHMGPYKSIEEVQQILKELGMRQATYAPVFESPDRVTFTVRMQLLWDTDTHADLNPRTRHL